MPSSSLGGHCWYSSCGLQGREKEAWEKLPGSQQSPGTYYEGRPWFGPETLVIGSAFTDFAKCASFSLSIREAGHSACARSVPFSPVLSTLATFPRDSAAPNVWVSDSFKVKEHCNIFSLVSTERMHPHGRAGSSGCLVFMETSLIKGASGGHEGLGEGDVFSFLTPLGRFLLSWLPCVCDLEHQTV